VVGFANGCLTESSAFGRTVAAVNRRVLRRALPALAATRLFDPRAYLGKLPEASRGHIEILRDWVGAGHVLGNHNYWHSNVDEVDTRLFIKGIDMNDRLLTGVSGRRTVWFRYPRLKEGATRAKRDDIRNYLASRNYVLAPVTVDFNDWAWNRIYLRSLDACPGGSPRRRELLHARYLEMAVLALKSSVLAARHIFGRDIRHVLLLHVGAFTALALDALLERFRALGVRFIALEEALEDRVYARVPDVLLRDGKSFLEQWRVARHERPCLASRAAFLADMFPDAELAR
jgi:peptidoglycan/xylan/chitin deacetylase (PgdA/CDA1 family)